MRKQRINFLNLIPFNKITMILSKAMTKVFLIIGLLFSYGLSHAETLIGNGISLNCQQPDNNQLRCHYRLLNGGEILSASARIKDSVLPSPTYAARHGAAPTTAILLLVDTSDPGRKAAVSKAAEHIGRILDSATPQQRFALASFDSELEILATLGSDLEQIRSLAKGLQAQGRTTELYRNIIKALQELAPAADEQRILMIFSDGLAEDRAYFNNDVVQEALRQDIAIYGLGYPRSVALSVGLQSLRRLADETGGRFISANQALDLPQSFLDAPFTHLTDSGALSIDISTKDTKISGGQLIQLSLETSSGPVTANIPVRITPPVAAPVIKVVEVEVPKIVEVTKVIEKPAANPQAATQPSAPIAPAKQVIPLWYWIAAVGILGLSLLILLLVLWGQRRGSPAAAIPASEPRPVALNTLAHLSLLNDGGQSHPISTVTYRIGRLADNDLMLPDSSISRHHAEIRRDRNGGFKIIDLDSMNGVFVNGKKIRESALKEADILEVGDVRMTFSLDSGDDFAGEETVMLKTALPARPLDSLDPLADTHIDKRSAATEDTVQ